MSMVMPFDDNPNRDAVVTSPPTDSISQIVFSPVGNLFAAGSWNKEVRVWEYANNGQTMPKLAKTFGGPILSVDFAADGSAVFAGGCDRTVQLWQLATNQATQVAAHDAPIRAIKYLPEQKLLLTGSWDRTLRYWDCRQPRPALTVPLPERVYSMDATSPLVTVGTAGRQICIYHLSKPDQCYRKFDSPLKMQTRCIANFNNKEGFAIGSIEGRVAIHHVDEKSKKNFSFKCHRQNEKAHDNVYAVNAIAFHTMGTFATCGSDGAYTFWDKDSKQRLKLFKPASQPITSCAFNPQGTIFAYSLSYDWSKGMQAWDRTKQPSILLHGVTHEEIAPRPKQG